MNSNEIEQEECNTNLMAVKDALEVLGGKWKIQIIVALLEGKKRFKEISRFVGVVSDKMLAKHLKELELHQLVKRTVYDVFPPVVEYELTEHGESLQKVIDDLRDWGLLHRKEVIGK